MIRNHQQEKKIFSFRKETYLKEYIPFVDNHFVSFFQGYLKNNGIIGYERSLKSLKPKLYFNNYSK